MQQVRLTAGNGCGCGRSHPPSVQGGEHKLQLNPPATATQKESRKISITSTLSWHCVGDVVGVMGWVEVRVGVRSLPGT